jgi:hypothetical protein
MPSVRFVVQLTRKPEVTQAEACRILGRAGLHRPAAARVLRCGFAGRPRPVGGGEQRVGSLLYPEPRVWDLVVRQFWRTRDPRHPLEPAALVVRAGPRRPSERSACGWEGVDLTAPGDEQFEAVRRTRRMAFGAYATAAIARQRSESGSVPLVVTVSGFVALGADVVGIGTGPGGTVLELREAGAWFEPLAEARVHSGAGSERRWLVIGGPE